MRCSSLITGTIMLSFFLLEACDESSESDLDSRVLEGRSWLVAAGQYERSCSREDLSAAFPVLPRPTLRFDSAVDEAVTATLPDGCEVLMQLTPFGAELAEDRGCDVTGVDGSRFFQQLTQFRVSLNTADSASFELEAEQRVDEVPCQVRISGSLTASDATRPDIDVVADFGVGVFVEGIERDSDGTTWVSADHPDGNGLWRVSPDGATEFVAGYEPGLIGTLVIDPAGDLWATAFSREAPAILRLAGTDWEVVTELAPGAQPNGITAGLDGTIYFADSTGSVWRIPPGATNAERWAEGGALALGPFAANGFPGPNGIKPFDGSIYVSNPSDLTVVRIPVQEDGRAGSAVVHARHIGVDDFAIDQEGRIWGTTHPFNTLVVIEPDGVTRIVADSRDGIWGPTDAVFGKSPGDAAGLYVTMDGNSFASQLPPWSVESSELFPSLLVRIQTDSVGAPEPGGV